MKDVSANSKISQWTLWFGLIGGALAWLTHLLSAYAIAEFGCVGRLGEVHYLELSLVAWLELGSTAVTTLASAAATVVANQNHARLRAIHEESDSARENFAWSGVLASGLFTFFILFESIPILFYLQSC